MQNQGVMYGGSAVVAFRRIFVCTFEMLSISG